MSHIALLRAVNVGGKNLIAMPALKNMFADLGFDDARTLLQSGNVVFNGGRRRPEVLESLLEAETKNRFAVDVDYFVRTADEWRDILAHNTFVKEAKRDPGRLVVMTLKHAPKAIHLAALRSAIKGPETIELWKRHAYIYYPNGQGSSKLTPRIIEDKLGTRGTARNWNTAQKLLALVSEKR